MQSILIIDDNKGDHFLNEAIIKSYSPDIKILKAYDGYEALNLLDEGHEPDIILLDINMPRMNGHDFLKAWRKNSESSIPVVVMLTSSNQSVDKDKTEDYKCVRDYLLKPLKPENMAALDNLIKDVA